MNDDGDQAPRWFCDAVALQPEQRIIEAAGVPVETLSWGNKALPGLLLLHGVRASAWWWSHLAPLLIDQFHVCAMSLSGNGGSGWRNGYANEDHVAEAVAVLDAVFPGDAARPILLGHSYGGRIATLAAGAHGDRLRGAIIVDSGLAAASKRPPDEWVLAPQRRFATREEGLAHFRIVPDQPVANDYIVRHIGRHSLRELRADEGDGQGGWTWSFDHRSVPVARNDGLWDMLGAPRCPLAMIYGERSSIVTQDVVARQRGQVPAGTPFIAIADADHAIMIDQPLALVAAIRTAAQGFL